MEIEDTASIGMEVDNMESKLDSAAVLPDSAGDKVSLDHFLGPFLNPTTSQMSHVDNYKFSSNNIGGANGIGKKNIPPRRNANKISKKPKKKNPHSMKGEKLEKVYLKAQRKSKKSRFPRIKV